MDWLFNPLVQVVLVVLGIVIFIKFSGWASKQQVSAGFKKAAFWLTGLGLVVCNVMYAKTGGLETFEVGKTIEGHVVLGNSGMAVTLAIALLLVFLFTYALMAEGPQSKEV
ncbi:MAG: hypothetical protein ACM3PA_00500 [Methanomassiliicoccales archaeon]